MREPNLTRRGFLGWAATGAAGLLLPAIARPRAKVFDMGRGLPVMAVPGHPELIALDLKVVDLTAFTAISRDFTLDNYLAFDAAMTRMFGRPKDGWGYIAAFIRRLA